MNVFAHTGSGSGWGAVFEPWEFHPMLNHMAIAFLLGGVALDLYAWYRGRDGLVPMATGLLIAGVLGGVLTAAAGFLAFFTVPGHTDEAHQLMYWHLGIQAVALLLFAWPTWERWRSWTSPPTGTTRLVGCVAALLLVAGSAVGGYIVYHGGAGLEAELLAPSLRQGHGHQGAQGQEGPAGHSQTDVHEGKH